jgi:hypothetical protein
MVYPSPFLRWDTRLTEDLKEEVEALAGELDALRALRQVTITAEGPLSRSKIALKLAIYRNSLLWRLVALYEGTAASWNGGAAISALLSARASLETLAVISHLCGRVGVLLTEDKLGELDTFLQHGLFANRDTDLLAIAPETLATNVLNYVKKLDKHIPGTAEIYDLLSERCHPNYAGHYGMFARLDQSTRTVRFSDDLNIQQIWDYILAGLFAMPLATVTIRTLDKLIPSVAALHDF